MKSFKDWRKENNLPESSVFDPMRDPRGQLEDIMAIISNFEPKEVEDCKDVLLQLQDMVEKVLTGGD